MGVYSLAQVLRNHGYRVLVIDLFNLFSLRELIEILKYSVGGNTLLVGWSTTFFVSNRPRSDFFLNGSENIIQINKFIKQINPNVKIALGGASSHQFIEFVKFSQHSYDIDLVFHGYSEGMLLDTIGSISIGKSIKFSNKTVGIYEIDYDYTGDTFDFRNSFHQWIDDDIPIEGECLPLEIARGCIFKCKFCSYPLLGKDGRDLSYIKTEENLLEEVLKNYEKNKILNYFILDDTFNERSEKIELMIRVRDRSKLDLNFVGYNRLDIISGKKGQIYLLKEMNFTGYFFGIESFNRASAKAIGKNITMDRAFETMHKMKEVFNDRVSFYCSFIIGLPYETPETLNNWVTAATSKDSPIDSFMFNPLVINRRSTHTISEFEQNPEKYGYQILPNNDWKNNSWDRETCKKLSQEILSTIVSTGRQKASPWVAAGAVKLGYNYHELIKMSHKDINFSEATEKFKNYVKRYKEKVKQHLEIPKINNFVETLVTFGCSFTYGQGLPDCYNNNSPGKSYSSFSWPVVLSKSLGLRCLNLSRPGNSNIEILNDILNYDFNYKDIVIILWTFPDRDVLFQENSNPIRMASWVDHELKQPWANVHNSFDLETRSWIYIHHAYSYLKNLGVKFYFLRVNLKSNIPDWARKIDFLEADIQKLRKIYPPALDGAHPGQECHREYAHLVWNEIIKTL